MLKRSISLPVVVLIAVVALVIGSFGTATAAGLTASKVKKIAAKVVNKKATTLTVARALSADGVPDNAINGADVVNGSLTSADLAAGTIPANIFAQVNADGTLAHGSRVISSTRTSLGRYDVTFDRDLTGCAAVAEAFATQQGDVIVVTQTTGGVATIDIEDPDAADVQVDLPFNILVLC